MINRKMALSRKVFVTTLGIFAAATCIVGVVQRSLYLRGFEATLGGVERSVFELKRRGAEDLLREIRIATQRSLQPGEYKQFIDFANEQKQLQDIEEFSFVAETGKVELSSKPDRIGKAIDSALWKKVHESRDIVVEEDAGSFTMFYPLRVDADLRRLAPEWKVGQLYGSLYLRLSKEQVNSAIAAARETFAQNARRTLFYVVGMISATLILIAITTGYVVIRPLARSLTRIIDDLTNSSTHLVEIAEQISTSSQRLSEGASEQAASLEETSSELEEMAGMTRANAANAQEVNSLAGQARAAAAASDGTVTKLNEAMVAINGASEKISKIIRVIEDIAFQTNLLALNAAVEAARAGEYGKGFAVVADEVRNLAQRAASAASETQELIEASVNRVHEGTGVAGDVAQTLGSIAGDVARMTELIDGIAKASQEQALGVEHVNTAVTEMDKVTQQNAAGAEESAAAAQELSAQAAVVKNMVQELVVLVRGSKAADTVAVAGEGKHRSAASRVPAAAANARRGAALPRAASSYAYADTEEE